MGLGIPGIKAAIALQVKGQALEQPPDVPSSIASPLEHFELVVQTVARIYYYPTHSAAQPQEGGLRL
jgi:hypothetical protein